MEINKEELSYAEGYYIDDDKNIRKSLISVENYYKAIIEEKEKELFQAKKLLQEINSHLTNDYRGLPTKISKFLKKYHENNK